MPRFNCPSRCGFVTSSEFAFLLHVGFNTDCQDRIGRGPQEDRDSFMARFMVAHEKVVRQMGWA